MLAQIDCLRRRGREGYADTKGAFAAARQLLASYFPDWADRAARLAGYEAACALRLGGGADEARSVWGAALKTPAGRCVWDASQKLFTEPECAASPACSLCW